jgi:glycosyltransferase involved in cell wall biosynthesis
VQYPLKKNQTVFSQERLRQIVWEVGHDYPIPPADDYIAVSMVHPRLGYVHWHVGQQSSEKIRAGIAKNSIHAVFVVRAYDVTNIIFNGSNAHFSFDLNVGRPSGNYYFGISRLARNYLCEIGLRSPDGSFHPVARSNVVYFDSDRPSGNYSVNGLFVGQARGKVFEVENIFDAPVYEKMNRELAGFDRKQPLAIAMVFLGFGREAGFSGPLGTLIKNISQRFRKFGGNVELFTDPEKEARGLIAGNLPVYLQELSTNASAALRSAHEKRPFHLIHCHDWYSSVVGLSAARALDLPMIFSLHSTEHERTDADTMDEFSLSVCEWERSAVKGAVLVIVPHSSTRQQVINLYGVPPEKVVIIPDVFVERPTGNPAGGAEAKRWFGLNKDAPMVLFAGEISHASGADLLVDALPTVCRNHRTVQFVFAGDGPLKDELEGRIRHAGIGHRCRFPGHVNSETFEVLLRASDFVVIPARTWQDEGLAQMAIGFGKPVLTTHQSGISCVAHGENGLITFDNPGSIVWGIQELLFNPLKGGMARIVARRAAAEALSLDSAAAQHYLYYEMTLRDRGER